jgi:hypothetical protein
MWISQNITITKNILEIFDWFLSTAIEDNSFIGLSRIHESFYGFH